MIRTGPFRVLAAALSVWLGICLAEPMQMHLCVMHGGLAVESATHSTGHGSHLPHATHHSTKDHGKSQQCSCLGDCTTGNATIFVAAPHFRVALPSIVGATAPTGAGAISFTAADCVLPYPNGPPGTSPLA